MADGGIYLQEFKSPHLFLFTLAFEVIYMGRRNYDIRARVSRLVMSSRGCGAGGEMLGWAS